MIKTLEERLADRKKVYNALKMSERKAQRIIDSLPNTFFTNKDYINVYECGAYFYMYPENIDKAELDIIPAISNLFPKDKWTKTVEKQEVTYRMYGYHTDPEYMASFNVVPRIEGTCRIIPVATGKTVHRHKYIEMEEPEITYIVDCGEGESDEVQTV